MIFDKTGTLTIGNPSVSKTITYNQNSEAALVYLASIERESDHPLAKAILNEIGEVDYQEVNNTQVI